MTCVASSTDSTTSPCTQVKGQYIKTVAGSSQYGHVNSTCIAYCIRSDTATTIFSCSF